MTHRARSFKQRGDTIIEVLLAIAVVSSMLGAAYVTVTQNLAGSRQAEERGEAIKVAETQLERLKAKAANDPSSVSASAPLFCVDEALTIYSSSSLTALASDSLSTGNYSPNCKYDQGGVTYWTAIERSGSNMFIIHVRWFRQGGFGTSAGREEVTTRYALYP